MAVLFQDGFDHYGDDAVEGTGVAVARMLTFGWASLDGVAVGNPANRDSNLFTARTGDCALRIAPQSGGVQLGARVVLPATYTELFSHWAVYMEELPDDSVSVRFIEFMNAGATGIGEIILGASGQLIVKNEAGATIHTTANNTIVAGAWHAIQLRIVKHASTGIVQLYINDPDNAIISITGQNTGASAIAGLRFRQNGSSAGDCNMWIDDLVVSDTTGSHNTTLLGFVRVATIYPRADDETGWTSNTRYKYGAGICDFRATTSAGLTCSDNVNLELGGDDYTLETFARFIQRPTASQRATLFSKWREDTNERSFRLFVGGSAINNGHLELEVSTDGTAATVATIASAEFSPVDAHWYHICVQRTSDKTVLFVDGVPFNAPATDAGVYFDGTALFTVGAGQDNSTGLKANSAINGFLEEVRVTKGVARYNPTGFTPPVAAFPRSVGGGDADFASVSLLMGFDSSIVDESSFGRAVTASSAVRYAPQDTPPGAYKTVNNELPLDDTGIEAPYVAATNVLTFSGQPSNNNTVTVDGNTYTFKVVFVNTAGNVLIGATVSDTIDNLVAAINGDAGAGTLYGTGTASSTNTSALNIDNDQMRVTANTPGTAGNAVGTTEVGGNTAWSSGITLAGGLDIPDPSSFAMTRLPSATTGVRAISLVTRAKKTDTGPGSIQSSLVTADDSTANGSAHALTTSMAYQQDIVEEDPSTTSALTPSTFIGARFRVDRTA